MPQQLQQTLFVSGQCVHDRCAVPAGLSYRVGYVCYDAFEWAVHFEAFEWAPQYEAFEWAPLYEAFDGLLTMRRLNGYLSRCLRS